MFTALDHHRQRGFTFIEALIASMLVLVLAYLVMTLSRSGMEAQSYSQRMNRVTEISQELVETMREDAQSSVRLFGNDATGAAYLNLFDYTSMPAVAPSSRLPQIDESAVFEPEGALGTRTGNSLLLARHAWSDEFTVTSGNTYRVGVYRLVYYYMTEVDGGPAEGSSAGLNLAQWVSEPLVDGNEIDNIADATDRANFLEHLRAGTADDSGNIHTAVQVVWKLGEDLAVSDTLRQITSGGGLSASQVSPRPAGGWRIYGDEERSRPGMLYYRYHSVATNHAPRVVGAAKFGFKTSTNGGFPHGFETQIIGPASARQILLHLSVVSTHTGRLAWHESQVVTDARDL